MSLDGPPSETDVLLRQLDTRLVLLRANGNHRAADEHDDRSNPIHVHLHAADFGRHFIQLARADADRTGDRLGFVVAQGAFCFGLAHVTSLPPSCQKPSEP